VPPDGRETEALLPTKTTRTRTATTRRTKTKRLASEPRKPNLTDRMTIRERPVGPALMHQTWDKLLFMHWQVPVETLRPLIPPCLDIDMHHGGAWIGVTPFTIRDSRPSFVPPLPWLSSFHEVNVRTYVHLDGVPGVWFFSLDATSKVAVMAARTFFHLPYHSADITVEEEGKRIHYHSARRDHEFPGELNATWSPGPETRTAEPGSLEFFWVERYCLYSAFEDTLYRARIFHQPWRIHDVPLANYGTSLLDPLGVPIEIDKAKLLAAAPVEVEIWPIEEVATF
jgi:uncharacterized protein